MKRLSTASLASAGVLAATVVVGGPATAAPPTACGVNLAAPQVLSAARSLPRYPGTDWAWSTDPRNFDGNFNPCATLSTALVTVEGATGSSPITALMFHDGTYLGTATSKAYGFTSLNTAQTTDDTVVLTYKTPGACNACEPAAVTNVRYQWQGDHVVMLDPLPPSQ
jgi:LppP/LprE lipoprotein